MSIEVLARCEQLSCGVCRNTSCKCGHPRNSQADILLQRFHRLGLSLPVYPQEAHTHDWTAGSHHCMNHKSLETQVEEETSRSIHSILPTQEPGHDNSSESDDDIDVDDFQGDQSTFTALGGEAICSALPSFQQRKLSIIPARYSEFMDRKLSDPAVMVRKERISCLQRQQRRFSDGNLSFKVEEEWSEEGSSSHLGCDSGYNDDIIRSKFRGSCSSAFASPALSDADLETAFPTKVRRLTPHPLSIEKDACQLIVSDEGCGNHFVMMGHRPKRQCTKHHSVSSIGGASIGGASTGGTSTGGTSTGGASTGGASSESPSINSLWECDSVETVTDILSGLGLDDFDNPQLIPDRFIPSIIEHARPSVMRLQLLSEEGCGLSSGGLDPIDLPLGATAETFLQKPTTPPHCASPPPLPFTDPVPVPRPQTIPVGVHMDPSVSQFARTKAILEPVPEETASDLSPSPRWFSPRVSIDHSVDLLDLQEGKLGSALLQKQKRRSLPQREGYRHSIGSQVESEPDSIYFSVTSYDEDIAREREREREELCAPPLLDDPVQQRRRRRGVYTPPPGLMSWLSSQHPISEEQQDDPDELPWPFSEQARLRKSLSEIEQAQQSPFYEHTVNDGCGQDSAPPIRMSPCRSPQLSDSDSHHSSHSGHGNRWGGNSPCSARDDSVDARQLTQEGLLSDTRQLDTRQRDLQDRKPSLQRKRLSWQKGEEIDFMMELLEAI